MFFLLVSKFLLIFQLLRVSYITKTKTLWIQVLAKKISRRKGSGGSVSGYFCSFSFTHIHTHRHARASGLILWLSGKESACSAGAPEEAGLIPGWGSSPGEGNGNPLQYSCLGNPVDRGAWPATVPGVRESRTLLKRLSEQARHSKYIVSIHLHNYKALCPQVTDKETEAQKSQVP